MRETTSAEREANRRRILSEHGAPAAELEQLLEFCACRLDPAGQRLGRLDTLEDEAHLEAWKRYREDAAEAGAFEALLPRIVQLNFPVESGISQSEIYRAATLRGVLPAVESRSRLQLASPERLRLYIHPSIGGGVPVLETDERDDFELLVQALTARGEPRPVPRSMGACLVSGLNNWDRIHTHRARWEAGLGSPASESAWKEEFKRFRQSKDRYQDRLIILSRGPYSGVSADEVGLPRAEWLELSQRIRLEHECTHYLTLRVFGKLQHNVVEELVADFVALVSACGSYRPDLAKRFLGIEDHPSYRSGGRLENYRGDPALPDVPFSVVRNLANTAVRNLELLEVGPGRGGGVGLASLAVELVALSLEELADSDVRHRLAPAALR